LTRKGPRHDALTRSEVELDPANRWWITRVIRDGLSGHRREIDAEYGQIGDALMPVTLRYRVLNDGRTGFVRWRVRPMSEVERQEFKRRVYRPLTQRLPNAHGSSVGSLRLPLRQAAPPTPSECPRLVRGIVTLHAGAERISNGGRKASSGRRSTTAATVVCPSS